MRNRTYKIRYSQGSEEHTSAEALDVIEAYQTIALSALMHSVLGGWTVTFNGHGFVATKGDVRRTETLVPVVPSDTFSDGDRATPALAGVA